MARPIRPRPIEAPVGPSIAYVPLTQGLYALIDSEDIHKVEDYAWHAALNKSSGLFYARRRCGNSLIPLHDAILGRVDGHTVDHICSEYTLDNRKANLRHAGKNLQAWNRRLLRTNTSGFRGTYWEPQKKLWRAVIIHYGVRFNLGRFKNQLDAAKAYDDAALAMRGKYAKLNLVEAA